MNKWIKRISIFLFGVLIGISVVFIISILMGYIHLNNEKVENFQYGNKVVEEVYDLCSDNEGMDYIDCINIKFKSKFEYKITKYNIGLKKVNGKYVGECFDVSLFYGYLLRMKGIEHYYSNNYNHIFVVAVIDDRFCVLDQKILKCS